MLCFSLYLANFNSLSFSSIFFPLSPFSKQSIRFPKNKISKNTVYQEFYTIYLRKHNDLVENIEELNARARVFLKNPARRSNVAEGANREPSNSPIGTHYPEKFSNREPQMALRDAVGSSKNPQYNNTQPNSKRHKVF